MLNKKKLLGELTKIDRKLNRFGSLLEELNDVNRKLRFGWKCKKCGQNNPLIKKDDYVIEPDRCSKCLDYPAELDTGHKSATPTQLEEALKQRVGEEKYNELQELGLSLGYKTQRLRKFMIMQMKQILDGPKDFSQKETPKRLPSSLKIPTEKGITDIEDTNKWHPNEYTYQHLSHDDLPSPFQMQRPAQAAASGAGAGAGVGVGVIEDGSKLDGEDDGAIAIDLTEDEPGAGAGATTIDLTEDHLLLSRASLPPWATEPIETDPDLCPDCSRRPYRCICDQKRVGDFDDQRRRFFTGGSAAGSGAGSGVGGKPSVRSSVIRHRLLVGEGGVCIHGDNPERCKICKNPLAATGAASIAGAPEVPGAGAGAGAASIAGAPEVPGAGAGAASIAGAPEVPGAPRKKKRKTSKSTSSSRPKRKKDALSDVDLAIWLSLQEQEKKDSK